MLDTLRRIVQDVNNAKDLEQALQLIVNRVKEAMGVDLCSVYLTDSLRQQHVLMATNGLNPEAVREVRLGFGEGLIGLVGKKEEVVNLADGASHPNYKFIPQRSSAEIFAAYDHHSPSKTSWRIGTATPCQGKIQRRHRYISYHDCRAAGRRNSPC